MIFVNFQFMAYSLRCVPMNNDEPASSESQRHVRVYASWNRQTTANTSRMMTQTVLAAIANVQAISKNFFDPVAKWMEDEIENNATS